jgi:myosin heavy subunit
MELADYATEGIVMSEVQFNNNLETLNLFYNRPVGLLALLDEASQFHSGILSVETAVVYPLIMVYRQPRTKA